MYETIKILHIISVVSWFAGLFYLPRLFVYAVARGDNAHTLETLQIMQRKLYAFIMRPAMIATWVFGLGLIHLVPEFMQDGWMHAKLTFVVLLTGFHHICGAHIKRFAKGENKKTEKYFRIFNEIPTVLLIIIVALVVAKPF